MKVIELRGGDFVRLNGYGKTMVINSKYQYLYPLDTIDKLSLFFLSPLVLFWILLTSDNIINVSKVPEHSCGKDCVRCELEKRRR